MDATQNAVQHAAPAATPVKMELFGFLDADDVFYWTLTGQAPKPGCIPCYRPAPGERQ
jgi:hypothetical protein